MVTPFRRTARARATIGALTTICAAFLLTTTLHAQQPAARHLDSARVQVLRSITPDIDAARAAAPPARWLEYIGEYGTAPTPLIILESAGRLHALVGGVLLYALPEIASDTFATIDSSAITGRVTFTRNAAGRVTGIRLPHGYLERIPVGPDEGATFTITPLKPVAELRRTALEATPPVETGDFLPTDLVELSTLDTTIHYDIRYATRNNFMGEIFYASAQAFMQRPAAEAVARASRRLRVRGLGLVIHDAYRPWYVTKMFWDATPDAMKEFVADPAKGSRHNRGAAVDLSMYDLRTGRTVVTVSGYDEFSPRAFPNYPGGTEEQRWYREVLREAMEAEGFTVYPAEWWHFDFRDWRRYRIGTQRFEEMH